MSTQDIAQRCIADLERAADPVSDDERKVAMEMLTFLYTAVRDGRATAVLIAAEVDGDQKSWSIGSDMGRARALGWLAAREVLK